MTKEAKRNKSERMQVRAVKGMNDVRPGAQEAFLDSAVWQEIFGTAANVLESFGYRRVWLPAVEPTDLFQRGIGEDTDIVSKEMYSFVDRGNRALTLRPEGTAGAGRAYVEHKLGGTHPFQRWWYAGPMFRAERPQKGRYRQFYQVGAELFGTDAPAADAEMVGMLWKWCTVLGLSDITIRLNTLGDPASRAAYRTVLVAYLENNQDGLCESCAGRVQTNPLRVLDCKRPACRDVVAEAPVLTNSLSATSSEHYRAVQALLASQNIPFTEDPKLVRGLDYYTGTLFEFSTQALGAQDAILGGGRYDELVAELGGPSTPAIGFSAGVERLALLVSQQSRFIDTRTGPHLYIIPMQGTERQAFQLADTVRACGPWRVEVDVAGGKLKQQMRRADKSGAHVAAVLGESEFTSGSMKLKELKTSEESDVELEGAAIAERLSQICG